MTKENNKNLKDIEEAKTAEEAALRAGRLKYENDRHAGHSQSKHNYGLSTSKAETSGRMAKPPTYYDDRRAENDKHAGYSQSKNDYGQCTSISESS